MGNGEPKHQQYEQHKQALPAAELHVSSEGSFGQRTADLDKTLSAMAMERTSLSDTFVSADCIDSVMGDDECESHDNSSLSEGMLSYILVCTYTLTSSPRRFVSGLLLNTSTLSWRLR
jgi:hypothetical protein